MGTSNLTLGTISNEDSSEVHPRFLNKTQKTQAKRAQICTANKM